MGLLDDIKALFGGNKDASSGDVPQDAVQGGNEAQEQNPETAQGSDQPHMQ